MELTMDTFDLQFDSYVNTIIEVLSRKVIYQNHAENANTIRDKSIDDLKQMIRDTLNDHIYNRSAHGLSYLDIGAMSKSKILGRFGSLQNATLIPITVVNNIGTKIVPNWTDSKLTISSFYFVFNGMSYLYPGGTVELLTNETSYLVMTPNTAESLDNPIICTTDGYVNVKNIHLAKINRVNKTISTIDVVRIGANHFSKVPSGGGIAVSEGVVYKTGSLNSGWK